MEKQAREIIVRGKFMFCLQRRPSQNRSGASKILGLFFLREKNSGSVIDFPLYLTMIHLRREKTFPIKHFPSDSLFATNIFLWRVENLYDYDV
jgi:hypothetical protein